jgi:SAM-dependent methyltransferase
MDGTSTVDVHPTNVDAFHAWDGADGRYWADHEGHFDRSIARHHERLMRAAAVAPGEVVLDVGCGNGEVARDAARAAEPGAVLGVDLSAAMVERARRHAADERLTNVRFEQADAQVHDLGVATFDVAISRTGSMFFGDPVAAFANIARALRPGGRLLQLVWQALERNAWILEFRAALAAGRTLPVPPPDAPGPFSLADPERTRAILTAAGFDDVTFEPVEEPMWFGADADDAYAFVSGMGFTEFVLQGLDDAARRDALAALRAGIDAHATDEGVLYPSAAWIVGARRARPA